MVYNTTIRDGTILAKVTGAFLIPTMALKYPSEIIPSRIPPTSCMRMDYLFLERRVLSRNRIEKNRNRESKVREKDVSNFGKDGVCSCTW